MTNYNTDNLMNAILNKNLLDGNAVNNELIIAILKNQVNEYIASKIEIAVNKLIDIELTEFLKYPKHSSIGWGSGNSRNGSYTRKLKTDHGEITVQIKRDRNGEFFPEILKKHKVNTDKVEEMIITLYSKGLTTSRIAEIIEELYGHHYSKSTISNITTSIQEEITKFHSRKITQKYQYIFLDATFINIRRNSGVSREALHIALGITNEGTKEIIDYRINPTESASIYRELLEDLKDRGLSEPKLVISDGLVGLQQTIEEIFESTKHQSCIVHIIRNIISKIKRKDVVEATDDFKQVYQQETKELANNEFKVFCSKWQKVYPNMIKNLSEKTNLFNYYDFDKAHRKAIYTTNIIEGLNKNIKRITKAKEQFPNEAALDKQIYSFVKEYNEKFKTRIHRGFKK